MDVLERIQSGKALFFVAILQVLSFWGVAPIWLCLFISALVLATRYLPWVKLPWGRRLVVVSGTIWLFLYYGPNLTVEMAACFLWLALSFKLLEIKTRKDVLTYVYTVFYLCAASLLFNQSLWQLIVQLLIIALGLYILLLINGGSLRSIRGQGGALLKVIALAVPLVVVLFLFFPRIAPLWTIPVKGSQAQIGFSDSMSPGDISELVNSDERVFRATFSGQIPAQSQLYWRGLVLDRFDGRSWTRAKGPSRSRFNKYDQGFDLQSDPDYYEVLLEPHNQRWLFTLAGTESLSSHVNSSDMGLYELSLEALQPIRYRMTLPSQNVINSSRLAAIPTIDLVEFGDRVKTNPEFDLLVPNHGNPKTVEFVRQLALQSTSKTDYTQKLMQFFLDQPFTYTLKPPLYGENMVDEFVFGAQRGFCEHFAGSMAYMLRLAGVPARVAIGYQGGERVNGGEYVLVRQYDAHAWVEAKLDDVGWVKLDPTALVAPNRIESNLEEALREEGTFLAENTAALWRNNIELLSWFSLQADKINFQWQKWVVNYSRNKQMDFFKGVFGTFSWTKVIYVLAAVFLLVSFAVVIIFALNSRRRVYRTRAQRIYLRWIWVMALMGYRRQTGEAPRHYLERVEGDMPSWLHGLLKKITNQYEIREYQVME